MERLIDKTLDFFNSKFFIATLAVILITLLFYSIYIYTQSYKYQILINDKDICKSHGIKSEKCLITADDITFNDNFVIFKDKKNNVTYVNRKYVELIKILKEK